MLLAHMPDFTPVLLFLLFLVGVVVVSCFIKKTPTSGAVVYMLICAAVLAFLIWAMFTAGR